jgi:hypothetical protein
VVPANGKFATPVPTARTNTTNILILNRLLTFIRFSPFFQVRLGIRGIHGISVEHLWLSRCRDRDLYLNRQIMRRTGGNNAAELLITDETLSEDGYPRSRKGGAP